MDEHQRSASTSSGRPTALILTRDAELFEQMRSASLPSWRLEPCTDSRSGREVLAAGAVRLVVIDDGALADNERGWLIDQVRHRAPGASIVYVAARHSPELERAIRARGVLTYTARPLDAERLHRVLRAVFERGAEARSPARAATPAPAAGARR